MSIANGNHGVAGMTYDVCAVLQAIQQSVSYTRSRSKGVYSPLLVTVAWRGKGESCFHAKLIKTRGKAAEPADLWPGQETATHPSCDSNIKSTLDW